jgi:hypothetical protein
LGAGEGAAQTLATGLPAITFNAEGINPATIKNLHLDSNNANLVTNYHVQGEMLTGIQSSPAFDVMAAALFTPLKNTLALSGVVSNVFAGTKPDLNSFGVAYLPEAIGIQKELPAVNLQGEPLGYFGRLGNTLPLHYMDSGLSQR